MIWCLKQIFSGLLLLIKYCRMHFKLAPIASLSLSKYALWYGAAFICFAVRIRGGVRLGVGLGLVLVRLGLRLG